MNTRVRRFPSLVALAASGALSAACGSSTNPGDGGDAGDTAPPDARADAGCAEVTRIHSLYPGPLYVRAGARSALRLRLARDRNDCAATYALTVEQPAVATVDATVQVARGRGQVELAVQGLAAGRTRLRAAQTDPPTSDPVAQAAIDLIVLDGAPPACPAATPAVFGRLAPGARIVGASPPLSSASIAAPSSATTTEVPPIDMVTLMCAPDQVPAGYLAVGPAVAFGPSPLRFGRELLFTVPANPALVPSMYELHTELAYTGPGVETPRIVPLANTRFATTEVDAVSFRALRLGTYQAVVRSGLGATQSRRHFTYRAIMGISMGGVGSSMIGTRHPERFDIIAPLGGPADSGFSGDYLRRWVLGGFCTAAQRATLGDAACAGTTADRAPPANDLFVAVQNFEHFFAPPGEGTGGTFDRRARFQGFRDIARMFGNPMIAREPTTQLLPLGVPATEITRTDAERCAQPVVLGGTSGMPRFYDDEYNPTGEFPVITFCDGNALPGMPGEWAGGRGDFPVEITLAVDLNRNGVRDAGEPVIRNFGEPYQDVGPDGLPSSREPGYDALTNRDPAGDDYDRQYNPTGTEGNYLRDEGEPFDDLGLDGVRCPVGETCPYDVGEGNGVFDSPGGDQGRAINPRVLYAALGAERARSLGLWIDGGIRDALQFGINASHFAGAAPHAGVPLHIYNGFSALVTGREPSTASDAGYVPQDVDWEHTPRHSLLRYGSVDASQTDILAGDGAHAGTAEQIANRLLSAIYRVASNWGTALDRAPTTYSGQADNAGRCANGYVCSFEFRSPRANRAGPVSVFLPPGYHRPENAQQRYPVLFVLHGYGMEPMDLLPSGLLLGPLMASAASPDWQRLGKMIVVFPDGRCREGDGCLEGTFYADAPAGRAQMETYFFDLMDYVEQTYRARAAEDVTVTE